ncbi:MAG: hypothetical protein LUQ59_01655 [Methanothrix sp.]|nr:hypothetical protein [Methanothrix sp.]
MTVTGITDQMLQYGKVTEGIYNNKPKHPKAYGIKRPESMNIIAALTGLFLVLVLIYKFV